MKVRIKRKQIGITVSLDLKRHLKVLAKRDGMSLNAKMNEILERRLRRMGMLS